MRAAILVHKLFGASTARGQISIFFGGGGGGGGGVPSSKKGGMHLVYALDIMQMVPERVGWVGLAHPLFVARVL